MSMRPVPLPDPDPQVAKAVRKKFAGTRATLAVTMRDKLEGWVKDEDFAAAFGARGKPGQSPAVLAMVTALQYAYDMSDREAAEAAAARVDWLYLLGLPLDGPGFGFTVLSRFRKRVAEHGLEETALNALLARLAGEGLLKPGGRQRTDSTHVIAAVRGLNACELVRESVRAALEALAAACPDWLGARFCVSGWNDRYGAPTGSWSAPRTGKKKDEQAVAHARDGYALVAACYQDSAPPYARDLPAVQVLRTVLVQNFLVTVSEDGKEAVSRREPGSRSGLPPASTRIISPYDTDARRSTKNDLTWNGYKLHVTDTCDDRPGCGCAPGARCPCRLPALITHVATTDATVSDVVMTMPVTAALHAKGLPPGKHYADSGYASADNILASAREHGVTLIAPLLADTSRQARENNGYDRAAFTIDYDARTATCPQGQHSSRWTESTDRGRPAIKAAFPAAACRACPARPQCTSAAARHGRSLSLPPRELYELQAAQRARQDTRQWQDDYKRRAGAEAAMSQAVTVTGSRRTRYRGLPKVRLEHNYSAIALNLWRLHAYWNHAPADPARTSNLARLNQTLSQAALNNHTDN